MNLLVKTIHRLSNYYTIKRLRNCHDFWINTASGQRIHLLEPDPDKLYIEDFAKSLSKLCRFNGHCNRFYSVAEHSIRGSYQIEPEYALQFVLHDCTESLLGDMVSPLKRYMHLYQIIECNLQQVIYHKFGVKTSPASDAAVHLTDKRMLATEARDLLPERDLNWSVPYEPFDITIDPALPWLAEWWFLTRYRELTVAK